MKIVEEHIWTWKMPTYEQKWKAEKQGRSQGKITNSQQNIKYHQETKCRHTWNWEYSSDKDQASYMFIDINLLDIFFFIACLVSILSKSINTWNECLIACWKLQHKEGFSTQGNRDEMVWSETSLSLYPWGQDYNFIFLSRDETTLYLTHMSSSLSVFSLREKKWKSNAA